MTSDGERHERSRRAAATGPLHRRAAALGAIDRAVKDAQRSDADSPKTTTAASSRDSGRHPALAALLMLREVREQLAGWESSLIETARGRGATWAGPDDERSLLSPL